MIGDQRDIAHRLRSVLPARWFGTSTPVLDTVLYALATGWVDFYDLIAFTRLQTRLGSASAVWLDLISQDFFGSRLKRHDGQSDDAFRAIVRRNILRPLGTRRALTAALNDLTGRAPSIFEPANTSDTGGYCGGASYGAAGGWGNLSLPFQCFVTAYRPHLNGSAQLSGWNMPAAGYGAGALQYTGSDSANGVISDADILNEIARVVPVGTVIWANIAP